MIIVVGDTPSSVEINAGGGGGGGIGDPSKMAAAQYVSSNRQRQSMGRLPMGVTLSSILRFVGVRSSQSLTAKANAPLMFCSPVNQIPLRSRSDIKCLQEAYPRL